MKLDNNIINVIEFIEEEMNLEGFLENIFETSLSDDELETKLIEYTDMLLKEIQLTLKISSEETKDLYNEYLIRNVLELAL